MFKNTSLLLCSAYLLSGCAAPIYKSPPAPSHAVEAARHQIEVLTPRKTTLSLDQADSIARPIFDSIVYDASQICMVMGEAETCSGFEFGVLDESHVNAYAGPNEAGQPTVTITRGLVEQFADESEELAIIVGHEFGHLLAAHPEEDRRNAERSGKALGATLALLSAVAMSMENANYQSAYGTRTPLYSQDYIDYVVKGSSESGFSLGSSIAYGVFSRGQENEADYLGIYLAWRNGYRPQGDAFLELGALADEDKVSGSQKQQQHKPFAFWNSHPTDADRAARVGTTLAEIEGLHFDGQPRPLPPKFD